MPITIGVLVKYAVLVHNQYVFVTCVNLAKNYIARSENYSDIQTGTER